MTIPQIDQRRFPRSFPLRALLASTWNTNAVRSHIGGIGNEVRIGVDSPGANDAPGAACSLRGREEGDDGGGDWYRSEEDLVGAWSANHFSIRKMLGERRQRRRMDSPLRAVLFIKIGDATLSQKNWELLVIGGTCGLKCWIWRSRSAVLTSRCLPTYASRASLHRERVPSNVDGE